MVYRLGCSHSMIKSIKAILFATDLTENCQQALEYSIGMAAQFNACLHMLHVIENLPENFENNLRGLLGEHQWNDIANAQHSFVKKSLLGKQSLNSKIREEFSQFCGQYDGTRPDHGFSPGKILIDHGNVADEILANANKINCDLIVLGAKDSLAGNAIHSTIKTVLRKSELPVSVVPALL